MQTVVGVLRGGASREHEVSLASGASILAALPNDRYEARDIYIDKTGRWHERGRPVSPDRALRQMDVAILPLHGEYGESGEVQRLLERFGVPYVGPHAFGLNQARHKVISKMAAREAGLLTPAFRYIERPEQIDETVHEIIRTFNQPVVVKPVGWGSSVGVSIVGGFAPVYRAVHGLFQEGAEGVLVEERVRGREATVGVIEQFRGEALYALPAVEIVPPAHDFFSYDAKYSGASNEICPGRFTRVEAEELAHAARVMHRMLLQRHFSRSDFIVSKHGIFFLELNSAPAVGLTRESLLPKELAAVGAPFEHFLDHLVNLASSR